MLVHSSWLGLHGSYFGQTGEGFRVAEEAGNNSAAPPVDAGDAVISQLTAALHPLVADADFLSPTRKQALLEALESLSETPPATRMPTTKDVDWQTPLARQAEGIGRAANELALVLSERSGIPIDITGYLASEAKTRLMLSVLEAADDDALLAYFEERKAHGLLDADTLLNYAALGGSRVFFAALAAAVDLKLDVEMVGAFIEDGGMTILERLLLRTDTSETAREAIMQAYRSACGDQ